MRNSRVILWLAVSCGGIALLAIIVCGGLLVIGFRTAAGDGEISANVDELFRDIDAEEFTMTYQTATTPEFRRAASEADYVRIGKRIKTWLGALKSKRISKFNMKQVNATSFADVTYTATFDRGTGTIHAVFVKSLGGWRLNHLQVNSPEFDKDVSIAVCPKCSEPHAEDSKFCPRCGERLDGSMTIE